MVGPRFERRRAHAIEGGGVWAHDHEETIDAVAQPGSIAAAMSATSSQPVDRINVFKAMVPLVPIFLNCYYAPQPTALRCYQLGRAVRESIDAHPGDLRVAVVGSGGLWHTPRAPDAYLDEAFDREILRLMAAGDARGMARFFDGYEVPAGDRSQDVGTRGRGATGMPGPGGPQGGTRETCNWIAAAAVADGKPATIVDYVPVYASPIGAGFAYWPEV